MIRILSILVTPLDYIAAVWLIARGRMLAPTDDDPRWIREREPDAR